MPNMAAKAGSVLTGFASTNVAVSRGTYSNTEVCAVSRDGAFA